MDTTALGILKNQVIAFLLGGVDYELIKSQAAFYTPRNGSLSNSGRCDIGYAALRREVGMVEEGEFKRFVQVTDSEVLDRAAQAVSAETVKFRRPAYHDVVVRMYPNERLASQVRGKYYPKLLEGMGFGGELVGLTKFSHTTATWDFELERPNLSRVEFWEGRRVDCSSENPFG